MGRHIDVPSHCMPGGLDIANLPLENLMVPCVIIDVTDKGHERYSLSVSDIEEFEKQYGKIPQSACLLVQTG